MPCSDAETWRSRARPCFGSFLTLRVRGLAEAEANAAINEAFALAQRLHGLLGRQSETGDLAALARLDVGERAAVCAETREVLGLALRLARESGGLFDPVTPDNGRRRANWRDIEILADGSVRVRRRLRLSFDGIAKGYAADRLCAALKSAGALDVVVDAGGDLALDCRQPVEVSVRDPASPRRAARTLKMRRGGIATSAGYGGISELWRVSGAAAPWRGGASVVAECCAVADALTKVVALRPALDLSPWNARALV